jgi:ABC-type bacteriocin/lantibiotic exporter with double-glycine peptidase domain
MALTPTPTAPYFSSRGKKIAILVGVVIAGYIVYRLTKGVVKEKDNRSEVQEAYNELDKMNQTPQTAQTITKFQAEQYANTIFTAVDGWETDEDAIAKVFYRMKNNADFLAVSKAFGIRKISSGRFNPEPDYKATMTEAIHIDMDTDEKKRLNDILIKKKIKFRI